MRKITLLTFLMISALIIGGCQYFGLGETQKVEVIITIENDTEISPQVDVVSARIDDKVLQVDSDNYLNLEPQEYKLEWKTRIRNEEGKYEYKSMNETLTIGDSNRKLYIKLVGEQLLQ